MTDRQMKRLVNKILSINVWFLFSLLVLGAVALSLLLALVLNSLFYDGTNNLVMPAAFVIPLIDAPIIIILLIITIRELRDSRQKLDRRVKERTAELTSAVENLKKENKEREKAEEELKKANKKMEQWSGELEKRVQEKTEEFEKSQIQLVQSEKLSAMGQLSAGLAHELNSPLAGLLPLLQKYKKTAETDSETYGDITLMLTACEHMAKIVRDFGSFARKPAKELSKLRIEDIIESTLSFSSGELEKKGIEIIKKYQGSLPEVLGNKTELQQVVLNIITNARDAMPEGGTFIIETGMSGDKVKAEFADNGVEISSENIGRVFDPFFTTKPQGKGIGLGLSISYGIIKNHGGDILVQSEHEKGTKFTVLLPAAVNKGETKDG